VVPIERVRSCLVADRRNGPDRSVSGSDLAVAGHKSAPKAAAINVTETERGRQFSSYSGGTVHVVDKPLWPPR
jgi:hypothetical protein